MTTIFYRPEMSVPSLDSYSPSAGKPKAFVDAMRDRPMTKIISPHPVTVTDLKRVHNADYVDEVFSRKTPNGFGNRDARVPLSTLFTVGSLCSAMMARETLTGSVCSPTSGFHHAHYSHGGGYCTFNGLMVAADKYLEKYPDRTVGILDCDVHYGDGTADILRRSPGFGTSVIHHTAGKHFTPGSRVHPSDFFEWLDLSIKDLEDSCDIVIYQAGNDMAEGDPLGGYLSPVAMARRDIEVFDGLGDKVVWNLAGGYRSMNVLVHSHIDTANYAEKAVHA